jgi:hypothetical protein
MSFPPIVRRAILDRQPSRRRRTQPGSTVTSVVVRLAVAPERVRLFKIDARYRQLNLSTKELSCLQPIQITLFWNRYACRSVRLIINQRRAYLLSVTETGIVVFSYSKIS